MFKKIPEKILTINNIFINNGYELHIVGGAVRDMIMDKTPKDYDLVTNAYPDEIVRLLEEDFELDLVGKQFGVVLVDGEFEIATYRQDISLGRHPEVRLGA